MQPLRRPDSIGNQHFLLNRSLAYTVLLTIIHGVIGGNKNRHVVPRLARQERIDGPEIPLAAGSPDGLVHIAAAAVISRDD